MGANWLPTTWPYPSFSMISRKTWSYCGKEFAGCASRVDAHGMKARHNISTALVRRADRRILQRFMRAPFLLLHGVGLWLTEAGCVLSGCKVNEFHARQKVQSDWFGLRRLRGMGSRWAFPKTRATLTIRRG